MLRVVLLRCLVLLCLSIISLNVVAQERFGEFKQGDYKLGPGDAIRILVFQNPDLTLDTRVNESGLITYPLIGSVSIGGMTIAQAERNIAQALKAGGFVQQPQVNIVLVQVRGNQVSVLGLVNRPGRFPLETTQTRLTEVLAIAGGITIGQGAFGGGSDRVILQGVRAGLPYRKEVDIAELFLANRPEDDIEVFAGDAIYIAPAPIYYIYGESQRSGSYRLKRGMTVQQALVEAGGPTARGTERGLRLDRKSLTGNIESFRPQMNEFVQADDVLYVNESLF